MVMVSRPSVAGVLVLVGGLCLTPTEAAWARSPAGPGAGAGSRQVENGKSGSPPALAPDESKTSATKPRTHKVGKAPKTPNPRLPPGAAKQPEDLAARRAVADGNPLSQGQKKLSDPELVALRDAERILFPRPLTGFQSGWSWDDTDPSAQKQGLPPVVQALPSATQKSAVQAEWLRSLSLPDFPVRFDERVVKYLEFYRDNKSGKAIARAWARKIGRYTAAMQAELSKAGLPKDLVWLSLVESGHNPTAASPAGAAGMWQFMPDTGRMYGLTVDRWVDERLDVPRATQAAAAYLSDLYQRFGTWELAMAAYNMGQGGLLRSMRKYNSNDFWKLSRYEAGLPWETSLYVPKVFALSIVMNNKRAFGLDDIELDAAVRFDTIYVDPGVSLEAVSQASGVPVESLSSMNPQYQSARVPPTSPNDSTTAGPWPVKLPSGLGTKAASALGKEKHGGRHRTIVVRFGDTLESIAARWRTTDNALQTLNALRPGEELPAGSVLLVPSVADAPHPDSEEVVVVSTESPAVPGRKRVFYRVLRGDTLQSIATALAISPLELATWNDLDANAKLQSEMTLQAFVLPNVDLSSVRHVTAQGSRVLQAGDTEFVDYFEGLNGRKRIVVKAKAGDSLTTIGKRFGLSVGMMERINRFPRTQKLKDGEPIIVYAKQNAKGDSDAPAPLARAEAPRPDLLPPLE